MASVSVPPPASTYAMPPASAGSPPPTSEPPPRSPPPTPAPEVTPAPVSSPVGADPPNFPNLSSSPPPLVPPSNGSSPPPSPAPPAPAPPPGNSSLPPTPPVVPLSPPPPPPLRSPPPPSPLTTPVSPPPPTPDLPESSPPPPSTSPSPPSDPPKVSPPPTPVKAPERSPPSTPSKSPLKSPPPPSKSPPKSPPPPSKLSPPPDPPKASPPPPPSEPPTSSSPPSRLTPPPTHSPSPSPPKVSPPSPARLAAVNPASSPSPQSATPNPPPNTANPPHEKNSGLGTGGTVGIGAGMGIFILSVIGLVIWCANRRRRKFSKGHIIPTSITTSPASDASVMKVPSSAPLIGSSSRSEFLYLANNPSGGLGNSRLWFTYDDLVKATNGFSAENFLGEGGFGSVYKGVLQSGREVAVKQLKVGAKQGEREFRAEVDIISRIHHRYLVSLVGYCIDDNRKLLVYDYVPNDTLYFHLHGNGRPVLDWATRVKIAAGAARGLAYVHEDCHPRIIHRDIKSSNILLDNNFDAQVSDFGLAKIALDAHTHITTRVMGTFGYMAPEYAISGKLTEKSDVYSFGVLLLELITGRKPVDTSQPLGDEGLVEWARPLMSHALDHGEFEGLVDPRLEGNYVESEMVRVIEAAAACVRHSAAKRPRMGQIVRAFDGFVEPDLTNGMRLGESEIFNSAQQSLEIQAFQRMQFGSEGSSSEYFSQSMMISRTSIS